MRMLAEKVNIVEPARRLTSLQSILTPDFSGGDMQARLEMFDYHVDGV